MSKSAELKYRYNLPREVFDYLEKLENVEQQNKELLEFAKEMREIGKLNPDRLPEYTDIIYHHANDLITRITGVIP